MVFYFVQRGETLFAIAKRYQTTVHAIVAANRLDDPNGICPGQALIIPRPGEVPLPPPGGIVHLVRPGETPFQLADKFGTTVPEILRANQIAHPEFIMAGQQLVIPELPEPGDDWPTVGRTPARTGVTAVSLSGIPVEAWSYAPRHHIGLRPSAPVIRYERVFAGLGDGHYYAFDRHTGSVKWRTAAIAGELDESLIGASLAAPALYDGLAYLCGPDGTVKAVDAHSGRKVWQVSLGGPVTGAPAVVDGILYVGGWNRHIYALEGKTGAIAWKTNVEARVLHPVALGDDHLYAVTEGGQLLALDMSTGSVHWRVDTDQSCPPVFAELLVIAGGVAFDPATGEQVWRAPGVAESPVVRFDQVLYPDRAVDLFTGEARVVEALSSLKGRSHLLAGESLLLATENQTLMAWDVTTDRERWSLELEAPATAQPAVAPSQIAVTLEDGSVVAFRMEVE